MDNARELAQQLVNSAPLAIAALKESSAPPAKCR